MISILVLVPCRNEGRVIERKLRNLARCEWPVTDRPHRIVVIDDQSDDDTSEIAGRLAEELFSTDPHGPRLAVVANTTRPGKSGAIASGLAEREHEELILLTDADVVFAPEAIVRLAESFSADRRLDMSCGAQRFVSALPEDGSEPAARDSAGGTYDRVTAWVRSLESAFGLLVSVHGQCLAWRAGKGIEPTPNLAADDLDLMLQVRATGARVERIGSACFYERKTPPGAGREDQAIRRARAYVQFLRHPRIAELSRAGGRGGVLTRLQGWSYRRLPTAAPWLLLVGVLGALQVLFLTRGPEAAGLAFGVVLVLAISPPGRRLIGLMRVIVVATRRERAAGMTDVWETARR